MFYTETVITETIKDKLDYTILLDDVLTEVTLYMFRGAYQGGLKTKYIAYLDDLNLIGSNPDKVMEQVLLYLNSNPLKEFNDSLVKYPINDKGAIEYININSYNRYKPIAINLFNLPSNYQKSYVTDMGELELESSSLESLTGLIKLYYKHK